MHELGLCASIVDAVEQRAGERKVARVRVRVGRLNHVHPDAFDQSFTVASAGTVAEDAIAELVLTPVRARCEQCRHLFESDDVPAACTRCGSVDLELVSGDELVLELVEYRG